MRDLDQQIIKFEHEKNFRYEDFYVSKSNEHIFNFIDSWPKWEKNFVNINGENFSGKTHIVNIFLKKYKGIKLEAKTLNNDHLKEIKLHENVILENLEKNINEKLIYTLFNIIEQDNPVVQELESFTRITDTMPVKSELKPLQYYSKTTPIESEE